jgi:hypothetical protein
MADLQTLAGTRAAAAGGLSSVNTALFEPILFFFLLFIALLKEELM